MQQSFAWNYFNLNVSYSLNNMSLSFVLPFLARVTNTDCRALALVLFLPPALIELQALEFQSCKHGSCQPLYGPYIDCVNHI